MQKNYKLGDEITTINGGYPSRTFTGTIIGFDKKGYLVTYEYGWVLTEKIINTDDLDVDHKYLNTRVWYVSEIDIQKSPSELARIEENKRLKRIEARKPSNELVSHIVEDLPSNNGHHAECYPHPKNNKKILLATNCPVRKIMTRGKFPKSKYFPRPRSVGKLGKTEVYEMEKYLPVDRTKLSKLDEKIYKELTFGYFFGFDELKANKHIPKHIKTLILQAKNALNKEGWKAEFDACNHNMMMTRSGQLIFTDLFYINKSQYMHKG